MRVKEAQIHVSFNAARVTNVSFSAKHPLDRELLDEVWMSTIGPAIERLDRELRREMEAIALELERRESQKPR